MIYSCLHIDTTGPNGTQLRPRPAEDNELIYIGEISDRHFYVGTVGDNQPADIDLRTETMTYEISALIKKSKLASAKKQAVRKDIEENVGDLHDLIADQSKTIEFLFVLVARMAEEFLGGSVIPEAKRTEYLARIQAVTAALDANTITLRGDFTNPDVMLEEVMGRTDAINKIVKSKYAEKIDALVNT